MKKSFQKPKNLVSFMLVLAILTSSFAIPSNAETVKAETYTTNIKPSDYKNYVDYLEALTLSLGGKKVSSDDNTNMMSGIDENGNALYHTYSSWATQMGYTIPANCTTLLVNHGNIPAVGYNSDGTKTVIVMADGYNGWGYNENGYDRSGNSFNKSYNDDVNDECEFGCNYSDITIKDVAFTNATSKGSYTLYKDLFDRTKKGLNEYQFQVDYLTLACGKVSFDSECISYDVKTKKINVNASGYGTYKVTVTCKNHDKKSTWSKNVKVIPSGEEYYVDDIPRTTYKNKKKRISFVRVYSRVMDYDTIRNVEYKISRTKDFKKIIAKGKIKCTGTLCKIIKDDGHITYFRSKGNRTKYIKEHYTKDRTEYFKYRIYTVVNGKKLYSPWRIAKINAKF